MRRRPLVARAALAAAAIGALLAAPFAAGSAGAQGASQGTGPADAAPVRFRYHDGHAEEVAVRAWDSLPYVSAGDVARLVGARRSWRGEALRLTLRVGDRSVHFTPGNPVATVDGKPLLLTGPVRVWDGRFWIPLDFVTHDLVALSGGQAAWSERRREFLVGRGVANIRSLTAERFGDSVLMRLETTRLLPHDLVLEGPRVIVVTLRGGVLPADSLVVRGEEAALVDSIDGEQVPAGAALRIALAHDVVAATATVSRAPVGVRLLLSLPSGGDTLGPPALGGPAGEAEGRAGEGAAAVAAPPPLPTVVIDPGHGGGDAGAIGASGVREKDVTLAVAVALRTRIEQRLGLRVVLTREADEEVSTGRRPEIANAAGGGLFLSLHCDAWDDDQAHGVAAYYLWTTTPDDIAASRAAPGAPGPPPARGGPEPDPRFVRWDEAQTPFVDESMRLASTLASALERVLETPGRGASEGPFAVLIGAAMPAALVELGFLTNAEDERILGSPAYRDRVADALFQGVEAFFRDEGRPAVDVGMTASDPRRVR